MKWASVIVCVLLLSVAIAEKGYNVSRGCHWTWRFSIDTEALTLSDMAIFHRNYGDHESHGVHGTREIHEVREMKMEKERESEMKMARANDTLLIMAWNVENFFDYRPDGVSESEIEFSYSGSRRWTKKRFYTKCAAVAKTILWVGSCRGRLPDVIVFEEVENAFVLRQLLQKTVLRKLDYGIVHYDSPDPRGIDVAMIYRKSRLSLVDSRPVPVGTFLARDLLLSCFRTVGGDSLAVTGCHFPSKYGGGESEWKREAAVARLVTLQDSLACSGWRRYISIGDFNDTPESAVFERLRECNLSFLRYPEKSGNRLRDAGAREKTGIGENRSDSWYRGAGWYRSIDGHRSGGGHGSIGGSIRFNGEWQLIDQAFVSDSLLGCCDFAVMVPPFLTVRDATHSGEKPFRTYTGPRYNGGVSDHYPITVSVFF